jgi:hypothetical protein
MATRICKDANFFLKQRKKRVPLHSQNKIINRNVGQHCFIPKRKGGYYG